MLKASPGVEQVSEKQHNLGACIKSMCNMGPRLVLSTSSDILDTADDIPSQKELWISIFLYLLWNFLENCLGNKVPGIWKSLWECFWSWDRRAAALWVSAHLFSEGITLFICEYMSTSFEILEGYWKEVLTRAIWNYKIGTRILHMDLPKYAIL